MDVQTRIALAVCVVLGCGLSGKAAADALRRRVRLLEGLATGLRALRIHMTGMLEPVRCALERSGCPLLEAVAGEMTEGRSAGEVWQSVKGKLMKRGGIADALTPADVQTLDRLFDHLGQSGRDEQEALLEASIKTVEGQLDAARRKSAEAERLYVSLGILTGLMLALIVI